MSGTFLWTPRSVRKKEGKCPGAEPPLQPMEVTGAVDALLQPVQNPILEQVPVP